VARTPDEPTGASVVVIDDEPNMCAALRKLLGIEGYAVETFVDPEEGLEHIRRAHPDVVLVDLMMPVLNGMEVLRRVRSHDPSIVVIMITAHGTIDTAIQAVKEGAFHYITKPFNTNELLLTIRKATEHRRLVAENVRLTEQLSRATAEGDLVGQSQAMRQLCQIIERVGPTDSAVLIAGESGTGKELVARAIHHHSRRRDQLFVAINCASIPENLLESELFGHERGAFTGADRMKIGLFELAHQGTLFLDEIGELPLPLQAKLLRALERREIQRIGGLRSIGVDIRLVASTNRNLERHVEEGKFRRDLFFRLNVVHIKTVPLRDLKEDIPLLVEHILHHLSVQLEKPNLSIDDEAIERLKSYWWPGNVRELENVLERTVVLLDGQRIAAHNLPPDLGVTGDLRRSTPPPMTWQPFRDARQQFEREYFERLLAASGGNVKEAARRSGISRRHFYEKINELGLDLQQFGRSSSAGNGFDGNGMTVD
jgi:DNA-binding NtrC family response regulator